MIIALNILLFAVTVILLVPILTLFIECSAALFPARYHKVEPTISRPPIAVVIPAHNEEFGIEMTLRTILPQLQERDRLVVVADNCTDNTASVARKLGAILIERNDLTRLGKGFALDHGLQFLRKDPPEVVIVVDADCLVYDDAIDEIARLAIAKKRPIQAVYFLNLPPNTNPTDSVSALACLVKNLVRPLGLHRLGAPCQLMGTGMAFPWDIIEGVSLAHENIVEDLQLGLDLAVLGYPPLFCPSARVTSTLPMNRGAAVKQRTRWEHGHLYTLLTQGYRLFWAAFQQKRLDLLVLGLDLCVPPLSLLSALWTSAVVGTAFAGALGASWVPINLLCVAGVFMLVAIIGSWVKFAQAVVSLKSLLKIPLYVLWKIPVYMTFLLRREKKWVRTERDISQKDMNI